MEMYALVIRIYLFFYYVLTKGEYIKHSHKLIDCKISPITCLRCPEGSRKLRFLHYVTMAQDDGKVQPYAPAAFTTRKYFWYSFLLEAE